MAIGYLLHRLSQVYRSQCYHCQWHLGWYFFFDKKLSFEFCERIVSCSYIQKSCVVCVVVCFVDRKQHSWLFGIYIWSPMNPVSLKVIVLFSYLHQNWSMFLSLMYDHSLTLKMLLILMTNDWWTSQNNRMNNTFPNVVVIIIIKWINEKVNTTSPYMVVISTLLKQRHQLVQGRPAAILIRALSLKFLKKSKNPLSTILI